MRFTATCCADRQPITRTSVGAFLHPGVMSKLLYVSICCRDFAARQTLMETLPGCQSKYPLLVPQRCRLMVAEKTHFDWMVEVGFKLWSLGCKSRNHAPANPSVSLYTLSQHFVVAAGLRSIFVQMQKTVSSLTCWMVQNARIYRASSRDRRIIGLAVASIMQRSSDYQYQQFSCFCPITPQKKSEWIAENNKCIFSTINWKLQSLQNAVDRRHKAAKTNGNTPVITPSTDTYKQITDTFHHRPQKCIGSRTRVGLQPSCGKWKWKRCFDDQLFDNVCDTGVKRVGLLAKGPSNLQTLLHWHAFSFNAEL